MKYISILFYFIWFFYSIKNIASFRSLSPFVPFNILSLNKFKRDKISTNMRPPYLNSIKMNDYLPNKEDFNKVEEYMKKEDNELFIYCEDWSCGELEWEFAKNDNDRIYTLIIPPTTNKHKDSFSSNISKNNIYGNNLKNAKAISSGLIHALYEDIVKLETILSKLQNIDYVHYISESSLIDVFTLSFIGIISLGYNQSIKSDLHVFKSQNITKKILTLREIENYLKLQRFIKIFAFSLLLILTKNVKSVE